MPNSLNSLENKGPNVSRLGVVTSMSRPTPSSEGSAAMERRSSIEVKRSGSCFTSMVIGTVTAPDAPGELRRLFAMASKPAEPLERERSRSTSTASSTRPKVGVPKKLKGLVRSPPPGTSLGDPPRSGVDPSSASMRRTPPPAASDIR